MKNNNQWTLIVVLVVTVILVFGGYYVYSMLTKPKETSEQKAAREAREAVEKAKAEAEKKAKEQIELNTEKDLIFDKPDFVESGGDSSSQTNTSLVVKNPMTPPKPNAPIFDTVKPKTTFKSIFNELKQGFNGVTIA